MTHRQRGQTLPLTLAGVIAMLAFGFFAINYGNMLRWQIRAQNAADSAAQAILTLQTQEFNSMNATLYATSIEEYRIRALLNGMILAAHSQGGCASQTDCFNVENQLEAKYDQSVSRYTDDVKTLQRVTATLNYANVNLDAQALLSRIANCTDVQLGGDCAFHYGLLLITPRQDTELVDMDAKRVIRPYPGVTTGQSHVNVQLLDPVQVEVSVCAVVPSLLPTFLNWQFPPFRAMARGAATPVMVEQDWLQPGTILNLYTGLIYQQKEQEQTVTGSFNSYYDIDFGGNGNVCTQQGCGSNIPTAGFYSVYLGWWNSIPIHPFGPSAPSPLSMGCTT